ncbi:MAG: mechanosensitive ion channel [Ktedonobacteraceae bacterium]|nr:mechanosensitive ion channel [Ktedonobacteraceae bacterium]
MIITGILSVAMILASLGLGILLRRLLVNSLKKTVLDNWITQTVGVVVIAVPLVLGFLGALALWNAPFVTQFLDASIFRKTDLLIGFSWQLVQSLLLAAFGIGVARTLRAITIRSIGESRVDINMRTLIARVLYILILSITGFWILSVWQIPIGIPITVLGAFTVTLTVAFQELLKNLVAGVYILLERPFYIGDQINITSGMITYVGKVEDIQLRATKLRRVSGEEVSVPNSFIFDNPIINNTYYGERRAIVAVTLLQADFSQEATIHNILEILKNHDAVMSKPDPTVMVAGFVDDKIALEVRFWVTTGQVIDISDILYELHELLPQAEIVVREPL